MMKFIGLAAAALLLAGCASEDTYSLPEPSLTLYAEQSGQRFQLRVGEYAKIVLKENPTTGYEWYFKVNNGKPGPQKKSELAVETAGERLIPPTEKLLGAPGTKEVMIKAARPGTAYVIGNCLRGWEYQAVPAATVKYQFDVVR